MIGQGADDDNASGHVHCASPVLSESTSTFQSPDAVDGSDQGSEKTQTSGSYLSGIALSDATTTTSVHEQANSGTGGFDDLEHYVALGCLYATAERANHHSCDDAHKSWSELLHPGLPEEVLYIIDNEATRLLQARWIRAFLRCVEGKSGRKEPIIRVYVLPEDWGRRFIDRRSKSLKSALRLLLHRIDTSPHVWAGNAPRSDESRFDPWAKAENTSLYYLFNSLPSPAPSLERVKSRFARRAIQELLDSVGSDVYESFYDQPCRGLKSQLYAYQARSASLMIEREASPRLLLDPRLELRRAPDGRDFYFGARDGSFRQEARYYESNRGGILAETMGLGKTVICLALIIATKGHLPQIPMAYAPPTPVRQHVASLKDVAASVACRLSIPAQEAIERYEAQEAIDLSRLKAALKVNSVHYDVPPELSRINRKTKIPPARQLIIGSGTLIVVPRNLLHQWQSEIAKHLRSGTLKILVVDVISKRGSKAKTFKQCDYPMDYQSDLPAPGKLLDYDVILFTRNRFEQEIQDGADSQGRRAAWGAPLGCQCPYIGASRIPDCSCTGRLYESPLRKIHWLRIIIDEGHHFSSSVANAVLVAKELQVERRWVVSGTPAKNLVGVEVDMSTLSNTAADQTTLRQAVIDERKAFVLDDENTKAAKAIGTLASNFLMVRPWSDSTSEGKLDWDDYVYRHEDQYRKTYSGFSGCFLRTLEGLVVKTQPEDVERDIRLPPMRHRVVMLKPCWFDKMTANLFVQVLRANAITSERSDVDYLFHKNSIKARHSLIRNLRHSNFTWTGFRLDDVISTLETSDKYLSKEDKTCTSQDIASLKHSSEVVSTLAKSESWIALSRAHEVGMAVTAFPIMSEPIFSMSYPERPAMVGITSLLDSQAHVDSQILSDAPEAGLEQVGHAAQAKIAAMAEAEAEEGSKGRRSHASGDVEMEKKGIPSSCVESQPPSSRRAATATSKTSPRKQRPGVKTESTLMPSPRRTSEKDGNAGETILVSSLTKQRKRKLTREDELAELPPGSALLDTHVVGTTSAKLSYLVSKVIQHQATDKILIFYDGDNAAYYIAQCLELLYIDHRIYARTLDNTKRSEYVTAFASDPHIRVLLIDVACGALGLNLNAASVVLIVNPINRPGLEAQAIKRAHRIGQTKQVLVETLVLEGTIEEAIFHRAKHMSRQQHFAAKELEDDAGIVDIIQNARILDIASGEDKGLAKFALLDVPQRVFGRSGRERYQKYGAATSGGSRSAAASEKPSKKAKTKNAQAKGASADVDQQPARKGATSIVVLRNGETSLLPHITMQNTCISPTNAHRIQPVPSLFGEASRAA